MADFDGLIDPPASWADIPDLAVTAVARGGPDGPMNAQALALAARLKYLRDNTPTSFADYSALRAYAGTSKLAYITDVLITTDACGASGNFVLKGMGAPSSADNGGTVIVGAGGRIWKRVLGDSISPGWFGALTNNVKDDTAAFNNATLLATKMGGYKVKGDPGTSKIAGSILVAADTELSLAGCLLNGNGPGTNILIKTAALINGALVDITTEDGTGTTGSGTNFCRNIKITGGTLANAACGIRGHRYNFGSEIIGVTFWPTLTLGWETSQSWNLKISRCTVYSPVIVRDFVDWTDISGNNFEGARAAGVFAITVSGFNGGSYSARIIGNGFHHWYGAIAVNTETRNLLIQSNHVEDTQNFVVGNNLNSFNPCIQYNWVKANLNTPGACVGISFPNSIGGNLEPNFYSTDGESTFSAYIVANSQNNIGNDIKLPYSPSSSLDLSKYSLSDPNVVTQFGGSNNPSLFQPTMEIVSGTGNYTFVQYKIRYHDIANTLPYCITNYNAGTITIDTWAPCVAPTYGTPKGVNFEFFINGANSYFISGKIAMLLVKTDFNHDFFAGTPSTLVVTASNVSGKLRITITGAPAVGNITGWVKNT